MRGVGIVFSQFLQIDIVYGVIIGMVIVLVFAFLGGMKGITYTQVAQYCVLIFAFMVPAISSFGTSIVNATTTTSTSTITAPTTTTSTTTSTSSSTTTVD